MVELEVDRYLIMEGELGGKGRSTSSVHTTY